MRKLVGKVQCRQAWPGFPEVPPLEITVGGELEVSDEFSAYLVANNRAEYVEVQLELPLMKRRK